MRFNVGDVVQTKKDDLKMEVHKYADNFFNTVNSGEQRVVCRWTDREGAEVVRTFYEKELVLLS